jgi:hypothetical protein
MLNTIAKRIQSRLTRSGVKVSLSEIKVQCIQSFLDIENPTEEEILAVQEYFMTTASQLTVTTNLTADVDMVNSVDSINTLSIQEDVEEAIAPPQPAPLATTPKNELVANTAGELGIVLNTGEIELIASNVNYSSDDLQESLEEIKSAIIAFIQHRIATNSQKIGETLEEITQVATDGFSANSQQLTEGLQHINHQLQEQSRDFKSKVKSTLSVFQLPAAS